MAAGKARTDAQKDRAKDLRLQHEYGITLADRDARIREQNGRCKCCGLEFGTDRVPCVDHYHFRIEVFRTTPLDVHDLTMNWRAHGHNERGQIFCVRDAKTKNGAIEAVKKVMLPWSVRGILCIKCNRGLGYIERFFNAVRQPDNLLPVCDYLRARLKNS